MLHRFNYTTDHDYEIASQWNPVGLKFVENQEGLRVGTKDTSLIDQHNPGHFFAEFKVNLIPKEPLNWLEISCNQAISILLVHYNPLLYVSENLHQDSVKYSELEQFQDDNSVLSQKYKGQIVTFENEMKQLGNHFNQDVLNKANEADVIVCCYGEFMESPYREKHIFQGTSRGKVFIAPLKDYFQCQASSSY
ncbi:hypothetical protein FJR38_08290 [Anabaena sp. UHCC 0253]|uniref:hypothetical protein n=1 Tax=Anabaena sp. UHCC 0253 TaxID=2590019 RepID=UPI0014464292|nr:hypothetical protein [Anabaena sp. UHCC 0253]MTJ52658.1 hypothetical protein [Anabaena sp. UHCC 0253]